jgi:serine/threonine-protein kinase
MQPRPPMPQRFAEPVRLRPPVPAGSTAFATGTAGANRWLIPVLVGGAAVVVIVLLVVVFSGGGNSGSGAATTSPAASIQVGSTSNNSTSNNSTSHNSTSNQLPTRPQVVTSR